jgi:hypothetical protein
MESKASVRIRTVSWCLLVVFAVVTLIQAFLTRNLYLILLAAFTTYIVKETSKYVPISKIYQERGVSEEMFSGSYHRSNLKK